MNILVTGGASGLGRSITEGLASDNSNFIYFTYCKSKQSAFEIESKFKNVKAIQCDFSDSSSLCALINSMENWNLEGLINNALSNHEVKHFHKVKPNDYGVSFSVNVLPFISISQKAVELFRKQKFGKIVTILSSAIVNRPPIGWSKYVAEKSYIHSICKSIATENISFNITSNCISPAFMQTELHKETDERVIEEMLSKHPLKKFLQTGEVVEIVKFLLASTQQINGVNLLVNAGADIVN